MISKICRGFLVIFFLQNTALPAYPQDTQTSSVDCAVLRAGALSDPPLFFPNKTPRNRAFWHWRHVAGYLVLATFSLARPGLPQQIPSPEPTTSNGSLSPQNLSAAVEILIADAKPAYWRSDPVALSTLEKTVARMIAIDPTAYCSRLGSQSSFEAIRFGYLYGDLASVGLTPDLLDKLSAGLDDPGMRPWIVSWLETSHLRFPSKREPLVDLIGRLLIDEDNTRFVQSGERHSEDVQLLDHWINEPDGFEVLVDLARNRQAAPFRPALRWISEKFGSETVVAKPDLLLVYLASLSEEAPDVSYTVSQLFERWLIQEQNPARAKIMRDFRTQRANGLKLWGEFSDGLEGIFDGKKDPLNGLSSQAVGWINEVLDGKNIYRLFPLIEGEQDLRRLQQFYTLASASGHSGYLEAYPSVTIRLIRHLDQANLRDTAALWLYQEPFSNQVLQELLATQATLLSDAIPFPQTYIRDQERAQWIGRFETAQTHRPPSQDVQAPLPLVLPTLASLNWRPQGSFLRQSIVAPNDASLKTPATLREALLYTLNENKIPTLFRLATGSTDNRVQYNALEWLADHNVSLARLLRRFPETLVGLIHELHGVNSAPVRYLLRTVVESSDRDAVLSTALAERESWDVVESLGGTRLDVERLLQSSDQRVRNQALYLLEQRPIDNDKKTSPRLPLGAA